MADGEFVRIAMFRLRDCARRMQELSEQVDSPALQQRLERLSREIAAFAQELADDSSELGNGE